MKDAGLRREFELTSVKMRAMEMILMRPGADWAKVRLLSRISALLVSHALRGMQLCMLVAGPDWLTGVLSGMHNTNVWRILAVQMAPTTLLIAGPATMAGAFQIRVTEGGAWLGTSSLLLFFAAACQARCSLAATRNASRSSALRRIGTGRRHRLLLLSNHGHRREARGRAEGVHQATLMRSTTSQARCF
jgi:hypothetical protein